MACGHILQVGLLLRGAESLGTCPDEIRLSNQDRIRASPCFKATDVGARTLNDGRYLVFGYAFGQRLLASQYGSMERRTFTVLHVPFDILGSAFHRRRYLPKDICIV